MKKRLQSLRELWQRIKRNWKTRYKLVIKNEESQSEPFSMRLSPQNIFVVVTTSAVVLIVLTAMLIAFTPLRIYVPGYTTPDEYRLYKKVAKRVDSAEYLIKLQQQYIQNLNYILNDKNDDAMAAVKGEKSNATLTVGNHPDEDAQLQQEAEDIVHRLSVRHAPSLAANVRKADVSDLKLQIPVLGAVIAEFNPLQQMYGVCIAGEYNSLITSVAEGVVVFAGYDSQYGNTMIIQHAGNRVSVYKNNALLLKKCGAQVEGGEPIAKMGRGGSVSQQPYLQFELWYNGFPVDPMNYLSVE